MKAITFTSYLIVILTMTLLFHPGQVKSQDRTVHFMLELPQSNITNPAIVPKYPGYLGVPFLSSTYVEFDNSFRYNDIFKQGTDKIYIDRVALIDQLDDRNYTGIYSQLDFLSFGFSLKKLYLSFRFSSRTDINLFYSKDFIKLITYGNAYEEFFGKEVTFKDTKLNSTAYNEAAVTGAYQINDKLTAGASFRYLLGVGNVYSEKVDFTLNTDSSDFTVKARTDIMIHSSIPVPVSSNGGENYALEARDLVGNDNPGFAVDLGATYKLMDNLTLAASLLDLGSIKWNYNARKIYTTDPSKEVVFEGFDLNDFINNDSIDEENINDILDSIANEFGIEDGPESYSTNLTTKLLISGTYDLTKKDHFGAMFRTAFISGYVRPSITLAYRRELLNRVSAYASFSAYGNAYFNVGFGLIAGIGPVQFYIVNDNLVALFMPKNSQNYNARFGINIVFGNPDKKESESPAPETQF